MKTRKQYYLIEVTDTFYTSLWLEKEVQEANDSGVPKHKTLAMLPTPYTCKTNNINLILAPGLLQLLSLREEKNGERAYSKINWRGRTSLGIEIGREQQKRRGAVQADRVPVTFMKEQGFLKSEKKGLMWQV